MKKKLSLMLALIIVLQIMLPIVSVIWESGITIVSRAEGLKDVVPEFYGTVGINLKVGDTLDLSNPMFRIFAKDYKDGDITKNIEIEKNTVNTNNAGNYEIVYSVKNSRGKEEQITVPVKISNNQQRSIQRKLYSESQYSWNTELNQAAGNKGVNHDRQNLGIFAKAGAEIKIRQVAGSCDEDKAIRGDLLNNDRQKEEQFNITDEWQTIKADYDSVPFIQTESIDSYKNTYKLWEEPEDYYETVYLDQLGAEVSEDECIGTICYANIFTAKSENDEIDTIIIPSGVAYNKNAEIYINAEDGNINSSNYELVAEVSNLENYYTTVKLKEPKKINNEKFIVAVKYTGQELPISASNHNDSVYISKDINSGWQKSNYSILPIICKSTQIEGEVKVEVNIEDVYSSAGKIKALTYHLAGDDEEEFFNEWDNNKDSFAVLESDRITMLIPRKDRELFGTIDNGIEYFKNLNELYGYYDDVFEFYDSLIGLSFDAKNYLNKNERTKFFVKADINGSGAAYYTTTHTAEHADTIQMYLSRKWGNLHEIGHGYEGDIGKSELLNLKEVQNNIFAYYYKKKYLLEGQETWLGNITQKESTWKNMRNQITEFNDLMEIDYTNSGTINEEIRLYMMVNLLDKIGFQRSMAALYINSREDHYNSTNSKEADLIARSFSDASKFNVVPYLESWEIDISANEKERIKNKNYPIVYYLGELVQSSTAQEIKNNLGLDGIYSLVSNDDISDNIKGTIKLPFNTTFYNKFSNYKIKLKSGEQIIKEITVGNSEKTETIPVGVYQIELIDGNGNKANFINPYVIVKENSTSSVSLETVQLSSIKVTTAPTKTSYVEYQNFDETGMIVEATYSDASTKIVRGYTVADGNSLEAGQTSVTISYKENGVTKTTTQQINVKEQEVVSIEIKTPPTKTTYIEGQKFDKTGMSIWLNYDNDTTGSTSKMEVENGENLKLGQQNVTVSYTINGKKFTTTQAITVTAKQLNSISVKSNPSKTKYKKGDKLDTSGLTLTLAYNNGSTGTITSGFTCTPTTLNTVGTQTITVTYGGKTTTFNVAVEKELTSISVKSNPSKTKYKKGDTLNTSGLTLNLAYNDGSTGIITTGFTCTPTTLNTVGTQTITVTYGGKIATFNVTVEKELTSISVKNNPSKTKYKKGDTLNTSGLTLNLAYNDGSTEMITSGFTCTPTTLNTVGTQKITVTYGGKTTTFNVTVEKELTEIKVSKQPTKTKYAVGENFDTTGMEVTAYYNNGTSGKITNYRITNGTNLQQGNIDIQISYTEEGISKTVITPIKVFRTETDESGITWWYQFVQGNAVNVHYKSGALGKEVTIPAKLGGYNVTHLYNGGYKNIFATSIYEQNTTIEKINLPESILVIEDFAFAGCKGLKEINIPQNVIRMDINSFANCNALESITIPDTVKNISDNAFYGCNNIVIYCKGESYAKEYAKTEGILYIVISKYEVMQENGTDYITQISPDKMTNVLEKIETNGEVKVYKEDTKITDTDTNLGTGMTMEIKLNNQEKEYVVVVTGDLNGDGKVGNADILKLARYKAGLDNDLSEAYLKATDVHRDGKYAKDNDLLKMARMMVGLE